TRLCPVTHGNGYMPPSLNNYQLKLLAALLMVCDHVGDVFFPDILLLRMIGRFSFPLFAWLLVQGEAHTRNVWRYGLRLVALGVVSHFIYIRTFEGPLYFNILFTLTLGVLCLRGDRLWPEYRSLVWFAGFGLATLAGVEYEGYGIVLIALVRYFQPTVLWWLGWVGIHLILIATAPTFGLFQWPAIAAPCLFLLASGDRGPAARWFYLFYPGHLLVLYGIKTWLGAV
ncbi:MAG TPA: TraX family protein, partial [Chroococcidiopsis sp.]